ncbi:MAG: type I methionyl aminopeptidase [Planctomycetes bacterium]|nr:type I methionyl aminopeptidase [Planctomycetota bacterium]
MSTEPTTSETSASGKPSWWSQSSEDGRATARPNHDTRPLRTVRRTAAIEIRSTEEIQRMTEAGRVAATALHAATTACVAGTSTASLDCVIAGVIAANRAEAAFVGYGKNDVRQAFPASSCISVNEEVVHGIPGPRVLVNGDVVKIDCGVRYREWCADAAVTVCVGRVSPEIRAMVDHTKAMLDEAVDLVQPGVRWSTIAERLQNMAIEGRYGVVTDLMGHGIGRTLHEWPEAPNSVSRSLLERRDFTLLPGMTIAIEPMLTLSDGSASVRDRDGHLMGIATRLQADGWTVVTASGLPSAHFEHTIVVTRTGAQVLTALPVLATSQGSN